MPTATGACRLQLATLLTPGESPRITGSRRAVIPGSRPTRVSTRGLWRSELPGDRPQGPLLPASLQQRTDPRRAFPSARARHAALLGGAPGSHLSWRESAPHTDPSQPPCPGPDPVPWPEKAGSKGTGQRRPFHPEASADGCSVSGRRGFSAGEAGSRKGPCHTEFQLCKRGWEALGGSANVLNAPELCTEKR